MSSGCILQLSIELEYR